VSFFGTTPTITEAMHYHTNTCNAGQQQQHAGNAEQDSKLSTPQKMTYELWNIDAF
jgi:hypothetical protein